MLLKRMKHQKLESGSEKINRGVAGNEGLTCVTMTTKLSGCGGGK